MKVEMSFRLLRVGPKYAFRVVKMDERVVANVVNDGVPRADTGPRVSCTKLNHNAVAPDKV